MSESITEKIDAIRDRMVEDDDGNEFLEVTEAVVDILADDEMDEEVQSEIEEAWERLISLVEKARLGSGGRFKALKKKIAARGGVRNPGAVAASIGRKKYGAKKMAKWSAASRKRHAK